VKSCGPDASTPASSLRMHFRRRRRQESPISGESTKEPVKTTRVRECRVFRCDRGDDTRVLPTHCTRGCGCIGHPAFPTPSVGRKIHAQLGHIAPRDCSTVSDQQAAEKRVVSPDKRSRNSGPQPPRSEFSFNLILTLFSSRRAKPSGLKHFARSQPASSGSNTRRALVGRDPSRQSRGIGRWGGLSGSN